MALFLCNRANPAITTRKKIQKAGVVKMKVWSGWYLSTDDIQLIICLAMLNLPEPFRSDSSVISSVPEPPEVRVSEGEPEMESAVKPVTESLAEDSAESVRASVKDGATG